MEVQEEKEVSSQPKIVSQGKDRAWKRKKKSRRSMKFLYYIHDWNPGINSLHKTHKISFFSGWECADVGSSKETLDNGTTSLILFTINAMFIGVLLSFNSLVVT